jgi:putative cardiolipin synthase
MECAEDVVGNVHVAGTPSPGPSGATRTAATGNSSWCPSSNVIGDGSQVPNLRDRRLAEMVAEFFEDGVKPENSYRVTLEGGRLRWMTSDGGTVRVYTKEPETTWWKRFTADALGILPIHSML